MLEPTLLDGGRGTLTSDCTVSDSIRKLKVSLDSLRSPLTLALRCCDTELGVGVTWVVDKQAIAIHGISDVCAILAVPVRSVYGIAVAGAAVDDNNKTVPGMKRFGCGSHDTLATKDCHCQDEAAARDRASIFCSRGWPECHIKVLFLQAIGDDLAST
jgi:hypothetical protein